MVIEIGEFALNIVVELVASVIHEGINYSALSYFERRKIERRVEDATAEVIEPLLPFLTQEGIPEGNYSARAGGKKGEPANASTRATSTER